MHINEVLQLDKTNQSIKKIDLFLALVDKNSSDYYKALSYRALIMHSVGKTNDALKTLYLAISDFKFIDDESIISVCDSIISITLDVKRLDQSKKYIELKKGYLKASQMNLYEKDLINYYMISKEFSKAISLLNTYLDTISIKSEEQWAYECLIDIYFKEYQFDKFIDVCDKLEKIYIDSLNILALTNVLYLKLEIYYNQGNYIKLIKEANKYLNDYDLNNENKIKAATLLINSYILCKDYRKAAIIESNYEELLSLVKENLAYNFAKAALKLYTETNSIVSIQHYENLIKSLDNSFKPTRNKKNKEIIIPNVVVDDIKDVNTLPILERVIKNQIDTVQTSIKNVKTVFVSQKYDELSNIFACLNGLDIDTKFREVYRILGIELQKVIPITEMYLLTYNNGYNGLHYKKERAYDKKLEYEKIEDTINLLAINYEQEIYLDPESTSGIKNIVTFNDYDQLPYGVAIPLIKEGIVFGSIAFFSSEAFLPNDMCYEIIKLVSQMLNSRLIAIYKQEDLEKNNKRMFFVYENMASGIKELMDDHIHLSKQATNILGCLEDLMVTDYEYFIHPNDLGKYRECVNDVYKYMRNMSYEYRFKKNNEYIKIKESMYPSYNNGIISIYSLIEDITLLEKNKNELISLAYTHPISKLESEVKLMVDIEKELENKKFSLCLLDVKDFKLYSDLYGINFANQLIYAIALELKNVFSNDLNVSIYHIDSNRYAVLLKDINDRRVVDALMNKKMALITKNLNLLNSRLNIVFSCGVYRVAKNSPLLDASKVVINAYEALTDAKLISSLDNSICHYDSERAKIRFNENQLVTHISEAIDHGKIGLSYKQVADIKNNAIFAYYTNLSLDNYEIDEDFMTSVIKRRNLEELLDKYAISNASKEAKMLYEELKASILIFVNVSDKSLTNTLPSFIEQQDRFYKFTKRNIIFVVNDAKNSVVRSIKDLGYMIASSNLADLYHLRIDYFILDFKNTSLEVILEIKELCAKKNCELILGGIDTKDSLEKALEMDIPYIFGNYYRKSIRIKKLINNSK